MPGQNAFWWVFRYECIHIWATKERRYICAPCGKQIEIRGFVPRKISQQKYGVFCLASKMGEGSYNDDTYRSRCELTYLESSAIVNWVYKTLKNSEERNTFTKELLGQIKELHGIQNDIRFSKGVVYNAEKVEIHFLSSVSSVNQLCFFTKERSRNTVFPRTCKSKLYFTSVNHANPALIAERKQNIPRTDN